LSPFFKAGQGYIACQDKTGMSPSDNSILSPSPEKQDVWSDSKNSPPLSRTFPVQKNTFPLEACFLPGIRHVCRMPDLAGKEYGRKRKVQNAFARK